jgi:hypothetical protein
MTYMVFGLQKLKDRFDRAKSASTPNSGRFAMLCGLLRGKGSGASKMAKVGIVSMILMTLGSIGGLAFTAAPALAANGHGLTSSFGSETSKVKDSEPLSGPTGVAWSAATKEVYVVDSAHDGVARVEGPRLVPDGVFESGGEWVSRSISLLEGWGS